MSMGPRPSSMSLVLSGDVRSQSLSPGSLSPGSLSPGSLSPGGVPGWNRKNRVIRFSLGYFPRIEKGFSGFIIGQSYPYESLFSLSCLPELPGFGTLDAWNFLLLSNVVFVLLCFLCIAIGVGNRAVGLVFMVDCSLVSLLAIAWFGYLLFVIWRDISTQGVCGIDLPCVTLLLVLLLLLLLLMSELHSSVRLGVGGGVTSLG